MAERDPFFVSLRGPSTARNKLSDDDLLVSLKAFAREKGNAPFTMSEWNSWPGRIRNAETFVRRFGSWAGALNEIGLAGTRQRKHSITPEFLLEITAKCWKEIGRQPTLKRVQEFAKSVDTSVHGYQFRSAFGSYPTAREKAGLKYGVEFDLDLNEKRQRISDEDIINSIKTYARMTGKNYVTQREFSDWKDRVCTPLLIMKRYGWPEAMRLAGLTGVGKKGVWSAEECVNFMEECARHFKRFPSHKDLKEFQQIKGQGPDGQIYIRIWGSLTKARARVQQFHANKITWEQLIAGSAGGKSRRRSIPPKLRLMILERDNYTCQICGKSRAQFKDLVLEVDHVDHASKGGTDNADNLRTTCWDCNRGRSDTDLGTSIAGT